MTEQEKREKNEYTKAIELVCGDCGEWCSECFAKEAVCKLIDEGYRKAEEVRKETAREIFTKLIAACSFDGHTVNLYQSEIAEYAKQFGVEVEE